MRNTELSPRERAEQRLREQEAAEREERLELLETEEAAAQARELEERERESKRAAARAEADRLAARRGELEDEAQAKLEAFLEELGPLYDELAEIHDRHVDALRASRPPRPPRPAGTPKGLWLSLHPIPSEPPAFSGLWEDWLSVAFKRNGGPTLRERDGLASKGLPPSKGD